MATPLNSPKNSSAERGQLVVAHAGSKSTSTTFEPCAPLITDAGAVTGSSWDQGCTPADHRRRHSSICLSV